jgi:hypothetical protein
MAASSLVKLPARRLGAVARVKDALAVVELQKQDSDHGKCYALASVPMKQMPVSQKLDDDQS